MTRRSSTHPARKSISPRPSRRRLSCETLEPRLALATVLSPLMDRLEQHLEELPGDGGAAIINFSTGQETLVHSDQAFGTSSTIKSGVLYALARKIDAEGGVTWNTELGVGDQYGTNQGSTLVADQDYSLTELATTMIVNSNNWATNRLIDYVGMDEINDEFDNLGMTQTRLTRYMTGTGAPSAHGTTGPSGDYRAGWDNLATPREITSMLQQIHENDGLLSNTSYSTYWNIMGQDGDGGSNTRGYSNDYYGSDGLNGYSGALYPNWAPLIAFANKAGSNTWSGDPGDFSGKPGLGDHWQRSEAGRVILSNGEVLFYAAFADNATNASEAEEWIASVGYEMAFEHADSPVTYTPSAAQLDDGRVVVVRGNNLDNEILVQTSPVDDDNLQVYGSGALSMDIDTFNDTSDTLQLSSIYVYANGGNDDIDVPTLPQDVPLRIYAGSGNDQVNTGPAALIFGGSGHDVINAGDDDDLIQGESGNDSLHGGGGTDFILAGSGHDVVHGDAGDDQLLGNEGDDELDGGGGDDLLHGHLGNDDLFGGPGADTLNGNEGLDLLVGEDGADTLDGGDENDQLVGGYQIPELDYLLSDASADTLLGGSGDDAVIADDGNFLPLVLRNTVGGNDVVYGGSGTDLVFAGNGNDTVFGQLGNDTLYAGSGNDLVYGGSLLLPGQILGDGADFVDAGTGHDTVYGDNFDPSLPPHISTFGGSDEIRGGDGNDTIYGQAGHDDLDGGAQSDLVDGGVGNDELSGGTGGDIVRGSSGLDLIFGNDGDDVLDGGNDRDIMNGGAGDDLLYGQAGDDSLGGDVGADLLVGGSGGDQLVGGDGNDTIVGGNHSLVADSGADDIDGGSGHDLILGDSGTTIPLNVTSAIGGNDTIQGGSGNDTIYGMAGNDFVGGGQDDDVLELAAGNDIANGDSGHDTLRGGSGDDLLAGSAGDDELSGDAGADWLIGGNYAAVGEADPETGNDLLVGGSQGDILLGDSWSVAAPFDLGTTGGQDTLQGGTGNDLLAGQAGNDLIQGGAGDDGVLAGEGDDQVDGEAGQDDLQGGPGNDLVRGGDGDDEILGGAGHDLLLGEAGNDSIQGGVGRDILIGGLGGDQLNGNGGDDILLAGTTTFDDNDTALGELRAEWTSGKTYANRVANLRGVDNPTFALRLNGDNFLRKGTTVLDDTAVDQLLGEAGADWFLLDLALPGPIDTFVDRLAGEAAN